MGCATRKTVHARKRNINRDNWWSDSLREFRKTTGNWSNVRVQQNIRANIKHEIINKGIWGKKQRNLGKMFGNPCGEECLLDLKTKDILDCTTDLQSLHRRSSIRLGMILVKRFSWKLHVNEFVTKIFKDFSSIGPGGR